MPVEIIDITTFLELSGDIPVIDVRSPAEYEYAHIPKAHNIPLFTNEERAQVGTLYKLEGREKAILRGLDFFGPRMQEIISNTTLVCNGSGMSGMKSVIVYCWRGGMRSEGVAWLLDLYGFTVFKISGGYKSFRNWAVESFSIPLELKVLGGFTGSRKTDILACMSSRMNANAIDLEALASHRGSAFGSYEMQGQPSQEMFENLLALELLKMRNNIKKRQPHDEFGLKNMSTVWVEDESQRIGNVNIPIGFWQQMRSEPVVFIDVPFEVRLDNICKEYGKIDKDRLVASINRISKRLGGLETKMSITRLLENDVKGCFDIILRYYDRTYEKSLSKRPEGMKNVTRISINEWEPEKVAEFLLYET